MTGLPEFFTQTSDGFYDRHKYQIISNIGEKFVVDGYDQAQAIWFAKGTFLSHINVLDKKEKKGFK